MNLRAKITPVTSYSITIDGQSLGVFEKGETWNGMLELKRGTDKVIVGAKDLVEEIFTFMEPGKSWESGVVSISPRLLDAYLPNKDFSNATTAGN